MKNIVFYNEESFLFAKKVIIPNLENVEKELGTLNIPDTCDIAAQQLLIDLESYKTDMDFVKKCAFDVLSSFSIQLSENGFIQFGDADIRKVLSDNDLSKF